jgi:hypothetical protein
MKYAVNTFILASALFTWGYLLYCVIAIYRLTH